MPGGPKNKNILGLAHESAGRQVEDLLALDRRIESPIEVVEGLELTEPCHLDATVNQPLVPHQ